MNAVRLYLTQGDQPTLNLNLSILIYNTINIAPFEQL